MATGAVGPPIAAVAQPPSAGTSVAGSGRDPRVLLLAARVKQLACLSFWLQSCCGLVFLAIVLLVASSLPSSVDYDKVQQMCRKGELSEQTCRQLEQALANLCAEQHLEGEACAHYVNHNFGGLKESLFMLAAVIVLLLCCCNLVPMCGYCGARHNSQFLVSCFMVFNLLGAVLYVPQVWHEGHSVSMLSFLASFVLPCVSFAYAAALRKEQGKPQVLAMPLLPAHASQPVYPQPPQTLYQQQPPQAFYAPQQQQPQAYHQPSQPQTYYPPMQMQQPLPPQDRGSGFAPSAPPHDDCGY